MDLATKQDQLDQLDQLARRAKAAREYDFIPPVGAPAGPVLHMLLPTQHESDVLGLRAGMGLRLPEADAVFSRLMVAQACSGWEGVRADHALPEADPVPLAWSPRAVALFLDAQPDWESLIWRDMVERLAARNAQREAAGKNSNAASPG